jgi:hypothetical protein
MRRQLSIFFSSCSIFVSAQLPDTDVWLFTIEKSKTTGILSIESALNISNRPGYDNQPAFSADEKRIYYSSVKEDKQADICYYDLKKKKVTQLTHTSESEYSPAPAPGGKLICCVAVETDSAQRLHYIEEETGNYNNRLMEDSVGYFHYLNSDTILYFKLTIPPSLRYKGLHNQTDKWLCDNPMRSIRAINRTNALFAVKDSVQCTYYRYDFLLRRAEKYAVSGPENDSFSWHPVFGLIRPAGSKLFRFDAASQTWKLIFDLAQYGVKKISRPEFDSQCRNLVLVNSQ